MNRTELFQIAEKHGIRQDKHKALAATRQELLAYYSSDQGQTEIMNAPRIPVEFNDDFPLPNLPVGRIVDLLMQEVEIYAKGC